MEQFIIYPTLLSDDLNIEPDKAEWNHLEVMMRKMEQMEVAVWNRDVEMEAPQKELQAMKKKEEDKGYVQTWENNTTPKMHAPIVRVKAMLEQAKLMDETQKYLQTLQEEIIARRGTLQMCADRSRAAAGYKKRLLYFTQSAPNMMEIQKQCSNGVRNWRHMDTHDWETIPNDKMKEMLLSCITGQPGKR